jgi:hypothetical protein
MSGLSPERLIRIWNLIWNNIWAEGEAQIWIRQSGNYRTLHTELNHGAHGKCKETFHRGKPEPIS